MRDEQDQELDALFALVRRETPDTSALEAHFETRLMARLAERTAQTIPWHLLVWRMIPAFAVIAVIMLACSITINPTRSSDPFAAITNGNEDLMAKNYLLGAKMKNIKAIIGIVLVFALGAASGAVATHMFHRARMESFIKGGPESREEVIVSRLTRKLDLDSLQQVQVRSIVHENHLAMSQIRKQYQPQIQAILEQGQMRISAVLKPEQQERFRQIIEDRKKHHPPEGP